MALYFPQQKESGKVKQQYSRLKERASLILQEIAGQQVDKAKVDFLDAQMLSTTAPQQFWGPNGVEAKTIVNFEDICIGLSQHVPKDPKAMTVLEFYRALEAGEKEGEGAGAEALTFAAILNNSYIAATHPCSPIIPGEWQTRLRLQIYMLTMVQ